MPDPTQFDPDRLQVVLDHGEVVELDGGTLVLDGRESPSVVLRLAPWRARPEKETPHGSVEVVRAGLRPRLGLVQWERFGLGRGPSLGSALSAG
ncbi:MAG TPA: hypothetical protein VGO16_17855 [Pseudonocardiaceae bacterium]|jgi:hypothetical protein|nr:hypothetical protein [Pseudonocardiaceae bacterium]